MADHDLDYLLEVLNVDGLTEDELDARLTTEAEQLGVNIEVEQAVESKHPFQLYCFDYSRRSESIDSRASQSTGMISTFSGCSTDQTLYDGQPRRSRASLSFRDYDSFVSRGVPHARPSLSFTPLSTPSQSAFSLPLSQPSSPDVSPRRHFRRIRGLSLLRLHRSDSFTSLADGCLHCPQDGGPSQRRAVHKLPCGHRLCTQALRDTVKSATESRRGAIPSCCGRPIPGKLVEHVMTHEEQAALLDKLEQWDEAVSLSPSADSSRRNSIHRRPSTRHTDRDSRTLSYVSSIAPTSFPARHQLKATLEREDYRLLRIGQAEQCDRFVAWAMKQRAELLDKLEGLRRDMKVTHETAAEEMQEHHASATSDAEDKQVKAESDLRETQAKERRDNTTALKHMEAYCAGMYSNGVSHERIVTEQDRAELEKARWYRDSMEVRHQSAINVLRGEQNRRLRLRALRQDRELQELRRNQRKEELELERSCNSELATLNDGLDQKRRKMCWRWELQMAVLAKKIEAESGTRLDCRLPTADWQLDSTKPGSLGCLSIATSFDAGDHVLMHQRHDSTANPASIVLHEPESEYDMHATLTAEMHEFEVGSV